MRVSLRTGSSFPQAEQTDHVVPIHPESSAAATRGYSTEEEAPDTGARAAVGQHGHHDFGPPAEAHIGSAGEQSEIAEIVRRLERRYPAIAAEHIVAVTLQIYRSFADARIRIYVALLTEREAGEQLRWLQGSSSSGSDARPDGLRRIDAG